MGILHKESVKRAQIVIPSAPSSSVQKLSRGKQILFATSLIVCVFLSALAALEFFLRYQNHSIQQATHLDKGLIRYDSLFGWKLSRDWHGQHIHYDFTASYSTNRYGFRGAFNLEPVKTRTRYAVLGDSFTFGYGVNDEETFVHLLNTTDQVQGTFLNFSIPGYSTDQELLLLQEEVVNYAPDQIILIVYLGNDLFDNELPFPLQAQNAKPYFEMGSKGLVLQNTPVPIKVKSPEQMKKDLERIVFWRYSQNNGELFNLFRRSAIFRALERKFLSYVDFSGEFEIRYAKTIQLFTLIIRQIQEICDERRMALSVILMPGKTFVEEPRTPIAKLQDHLRKNILKYFEKSQITVIDLASFLRGQYQQHPTRWFYPHEGHLNAAGHRLVADMLAEHFR